MKVSLIIPVFNEEKYLGPCLDSILAQTRLPDEVVIVNNVSTDNSAKLIKKYQKRLPIKLYNEKRKGIRFAVTTAWANCTGDLILRTDADCIVPHNWVKRYVSHFQKDPQLSAAGGLFRASDGPKALHLLAPIGPTLNLLPLAAANKCLVLYGGNMAIRSSVLTLINAGAIISGIVNDDVSLSQLLTQHHLKYRYFLNCWSYTSSRSFSSLKSVVRGILADINPKYYHEKSI